MSAFHKRFAITKGTRHGRVFEMARKFHRFRWMQFIRRLEAARNRRAMDSARTDFGKCHD